MKRISILIAAYNAREFIIDVIESIATQKIPGGYDLEVIIGIDGCDDTWERVFEYYNGKFLLIRMAKNYGTYITFNTLMEFATGSLIARFDADDIMLDNYLLEQIDIFERNENIYLTRTWSIYTDINKKPIVIQLQDKTYTSINGERRKGSDGQFIMRRKVWTFLGAFKPWRCFADTDFLIRAQILELKLYEVEQFLYLRRVHSGSLTQQEETGYNSKMRKSHKEDLLKDSLYYRQSRNCYIKPCVGVVERVV